MLSRSDSEDVTRVESTLEHKLQYKSLLEYLKRAILQRDSCNKKNLAFARKKA